MDADVVRRAHRGDLDGLNFAGLVRLSFELGYGAHRSAGPMTGRDINGRDEQEKAVRAYVEGRGGIYAHTYEEPDISAWGRKRVRLPDGRYGYRVIRPVLEGALDDLKAGKTADGRRLDGIIVADIDRLTPGRSSPLILQVSASAGCSEAPSRRRAIARSTDGADLSSASGIALKPHRPPGAYAGFAQFCAARRASRRVRAAPPSPTLSMVVPPSCKRTPVPVCPSVDSLVVLS